MFNSTFCNRIRRALQHTLFSNAYGKFGKKSIIISPIRVFGKNSIFIDDDVTILNNARIEVIGKEAFKNAELCIGKRTAIGQNLHLICSQSVLIGEDVTISGNVFISDTEHSYNEPNLHSLKQISNIRPTEIGDFSFIGYGAAIMPGVKLGKQCIVGANAVVLKGVYNDYSVIAGVPARVIKRYNPGTGHWEKTCNENTKENRF